MVYKDYSKISDTIDTTLFGREGQSLWGSLFLSMKGNNSFITDLKQIPYWKYLIDFFQFDSEKYFPKNTMITGNFFIGFHSIIKNIDLKKLEERAEQIGAEYILVPFSRHDAETKNQMIDSGYIELPWSIESEIFISDNDIDRFLFNQIGAKRFNEMKRLVRKGRKHYDIKYYNFSEPNINDKIFCELHKKNIDKYGHSLNPYDMEQINIIKHSFNSAYFSYSHRKNLKSNIIVQSSLNYIDKNKQYTAMLAQGIDTEQIYKGDNLYITETYENYLNGFSKNIKLFNLGRSGSINKLNLGCNIFHVLYHYIKPLYYKKSGQIALNILKEKCKVNIQNEIQTLNVRKKNEIFIV